MSSRASTLTGALVLGIAIFSEFFAVKSGILAEGFAADTFSTSRSPLLQKYIAYEIGRCCLLHLGSWLLMCGLKRSWHILDSSSARHVLARGVMNVVFLGACGYRGVAMWYKFWRQTEDRAEVFAALSSNDDSVLLVDGFVPSTPYRRLYAFYPDFQRLACVMAAFQLKNLADTVIFGDGIIFFVHHVITVAVALLCVHPYAQFHGTFFFGISEVSTTLLAILANFDARYGVPRLEQDYPATRLAVGAAFIVSFVLIRSIMWPVISYYFIADSLHVLKHDNPHDRRVVWGFVGMLVTLSVMQVVWLAEIVQTVYKEVVKPLLGTAPTPAVDDKKAQ